MTTVRAGRSTRSRRRVHTAVGSAAVAMVAVATAGAYQCVRPDADRLLPGGLDPLVAYGPAMWNSGTPSGRVASTHTGGAG